MSATTFPTFDKTHGATVVATAAIAANRFVCVNGCHAPGVAWTSWGQQSIGVSETAAAVGEAFAATTGYSALVEASEAIAKGAYVRPASDGSGRAALGAMASGVNFCGVAKTAATAAGQLIEVILQPHLASTADIA